MSLIRHSPYKSTSSENVGPTVLTQTPENHNEKIGKNSINFKTLFMIHKPLRILQEYQNPSRTRIFNTFKDYFNCIFS